MCTERCVVASSGGVGSEIKGHWCSRHHSLLVQNEPGGIMSHPYLGDGRIPRHIYMGKKSRNARLG